MPSRKILLVSFIAVSTVMWAQEFRGTISGRVMDQQQALVPGVKIVATETETGAKFSTTSNADGSYVLPFLPPGPYSVSAEAAGFKRYVNSNIRVTTNEREQLDITLEVGAVEQSVTITAESSMLETATASTGQVINTRQIENMPINGRAPLVLAQLAYGVTPNSDPKFSRPFDNSGPSGFSMGGAPNQSNELLIDGSPDTTRNLRVAYNPPPDAVQEVKVETFQSDAAYGHTGGGTVNVVMRGGTNTLHGSAYEFNQVSRLAATPFFTNRAGQKKSQLIFNQWGMTAGGPVYLPKIYHGKDKMFWFFGYEGIHDAFPEPQVVTVPTAAERAGNFSQLLTVGSNYKIYDPLSGVAQSNGRVLRTEFPNNIIPPDRLSPISKNMLQFIPLPNQVGQKDGNNNYLSDSVRRDVFDGELGRFDYNISDRHKFFYNFRHNYRVEDRNNLYHNIATGNLLNRINWGSMVDDVITLSPTMVLNTRLNWTRFTEANDKPSAGFDFTKLGWPAYTAAASQRLVLPNIDLNHYQNWGDNGGDRTPYDIFQFFVSLIKIKGSHSFKFGGDVRESRESSASYGNSAGTYQFHEDYTKGQLDNATSAPLGQDLAAYMLGYPTAGNFQIQSFRTNQAKYYALFVQDDYRPRSNLTFNLGLRFEGDLGTTERFNRAVNGFDPKGTNPVAAVAEAAYAKNLVPGGVPPSQFSAKGGLLFEGLNGKYVYNPKYGYFSPRFGFAWTPGGSGGGTVVRGGFGVFVASIGTTGLNQPGFSQTTNILGAATTSNLRPAVTLDNPFPTGIKTPTGNSQGLGTFLGQSVTFYNPNPLNPYSIRWNLDIQRQLGKGLVLEMGYTGNHAVHLTIDQNLNGTPAQYLSSLPFRDQEQPVIDRNSTPVANPFAGLLPGTNLNGSTVSFTQLTLPFPEFTGVTMQSTNAASSYFHAAQVRIEKRFSHGLQFLANYQLGRTFARDNFLNSFGPLEKRPADIDRPHRFVTNFSYELPFGKGKPFLGSPSGFAGGVLDRIIGGWIVNGIYSYESGGPAGSWGDVIYMGGPLNWDPNNVDHTFDTSSFNKVSSQQVSNHIRSFPTRFPSLRLPPTNNVDASVIKNTRIRERLNLQFRFEAFNAFNHPVFNGPQLSPTNSAFGTINGVYNLERHIQMALRLVW
jgi:hypothetical protein